MLFDFLKKKSSSKSKQEITVSFGQNKSVKKQNVIPVSTNSPFIPLVLWWISKKKKGFDPTASKAPQWFAKDYGIDFDAVLNLYLQRGFLYDDNGVIKVTPSGTDYLKENEYIVYIREHSQYQLEPADFTSVLSEKKMPFNDIAWAVLNRRNMEQASSQMWTSLSKTYQNMASLLIEEKRYKDAIDFIFASSFIQASGMEDNNELKAIQVDYSSKKSGSQWRYLSNGMPDIFLFEISSISFPFRRIQEELNLNWHEIESLFFSSRMVSCLDQLLPFKYFEKKEAFELFKSAIEAGETTSIFKLSDLEKKLKYNKPDEHSKKYFYASVENQVNRKFS